MKSNVLKDYLMIKNKIAILLPYKENFTINNSGAASIWLKDYLYKSKLKNQTTIYGYLKKAKKPLMSNFKNLDISGTIMSKNLNYTHKLYKEYLKNKFEIIELHNRPESLVYLLKKKIKSKLIFIFHNDPTTLRGSSSVNDRKFIADNTDHIYFVSNWVKKKFFEGLPYNHRNNCEVLYPAIEPIKKFPKKENLIVFTGKLNTSKGFDIYGKAVLKILDEFTEWKAIAVGNEPRETFSFVHKNFKIIDWLKHAEILKIYSKASISVVPSKWEEPFGRTAMESAAYGCATITSKNGGLKETFNNSLYLDKVTSEEIYKKIKKLIINSKNRKKIQKLNFLNVVHKIDNQVNKIDTLKNFYLNSKFNISKKSKLKILHISQFDERNDHRLFNISISNKLTKGFLRNDHDVINMSYRDLISKFSVNDKNLKINEKILSIANNYRPNLIICGHNNLIYSDVIEKIKSKYNTKFTLWYEDALGYRGEGPSWKENLKLIEKNNNYFDSYFLTTHPDEIKTIINKKKIHYLPIPVDENIENLNIYNQKYKYKDLFFGLSHGVNFGRLKKGKRDEREIFIKDLMQKFPNINYNILGIANETPKWNYDYFNELSKCKIALNLSRGKPIKQTSSNRIASLIGNGIYTFIDCKTQYNKIFNEQEVGSYKSVDDLGKKVEKLLSKPELIEKYAKNGKEKYFRLYNSKRITKNIIELTF